MRLAVRLSVRPMDPLPQPLPSRGRGARLIRWWIGSIASLPKSVALWRTRWFRGLFRHDPAPFLQRTHVPVFALVGVLDLQVPALPTLERFRSLYAGSRASLLSPHSPAGVNHMLQPALTGTMDEYGTIETTIAPSVFALLDGWLAATLPASTTKARTARQ